MGSFFRKAAQGRDGRNGRATLARATMAVTAAAASVVAMAPVAAAGTGDAGQACARWQNGQAPAVTAAPSTSYDAAFQTYGNDSGLWSGADSTYSTSLPGGRELWAFSDTLIGPVAADGSRPPTTPFVNNSFVVTKQGRFDTVIGGTASQPESLVAPSDPNAWYWSGDPIANGNEVDVPYLEFHRTGTGSFDFAWVKNVLARFDADTLQVEGVSDLPSSANVEWGSYTVSSGGYSYVYGVEDLGATKYMHVARVAGNDLRGSWEYYTGTGWSSHESDSARVMAGVANEYSVSRLGDGYVLITQDTTEFLSSHIVAYFSCSPVGPFTTKTAVYTTPETGLFGSYGNPNIFTYNAHAHPELSHGNQLLVSYNVNSFDINDVFDDASVYRPRFIVATFSGPGLPDAGTVDPIDR